MSEEVKKPPIELFGRKEILTPAESITKDNLVEVLGKALTIHEKNSAEIDYLYRYTRGKQPILSRTKTIRPEINNKVVENHAAEIVQFTSGYFLGEPVTYIRRGEREGASKGIGSLNDMMFFANKSSHDKKLATAGIPMLVVGIYNAIVNGFDWLNGVLIPIGSTLTGAGAGALIGMLTGLVTGPVGAAIGAAVGLVIGLVTDFIIANWNEICSFFSGVGGWFDENVIQPVSAFFSDLWESVSSWASEAWESIKEFFSPAIEWFDELLGSIGQTFDDIFYDVSVIASGCWEVIQKAWDIASDWFDENVITPVSDFFTDAWESVKEGAADAWEGIKEAFSSVAEFFGEIFSDAWQKVCEVFSPFGEIFADIKDGILTAFKEIVNGIIKGLNSAIAVPFNGINSALRTIKGINILGLTPFSGLTTISVPQIPYLAQGAVLPANKPFLAMVGDQKHGTNVEAPLETIQEAVAMVMEDMTGGMMAGFEATVAVLKEILEAIYGIEIGDEVIAKAAQRYQAKMAIVKRGG